MRSMSEFSAALRDRLQQVGPVRAGGGRSVVPAGFRRDGMYVSGRRGRLFLAHDTNRTIEQHAGRLPLSDTDLAGWRTQLEHRTARLGAAGSAYVMLIAPNAHAVYPEDLPDGVRTAPRRPVHQLLESLAQNRSPARVLYPLDELLAEKARREVYPRTDTHWNEFGALTAYESLAAELHDGVPMRRVVEDDFAFAHAWTRGDLGYKRRWSRGSRHCVTIVRHPTATLLDDNLVENTGAHLVTECRLAPPGTCLVFGDSYVFGMLPFLAESFRRLVVAQHPAVDWDVVNQERPSVVLTVMSERFLSARAEDRDGWFAETRERKLAERRTRPRVDRWDRKPHVAPLEVEAMRASLRGDGCLADATLLCTMAYAGLWPNELHRLRWRDVEARAIHAGGRRIRLLSPLASDLEELRQESSGSDDDLVFPAPRGGQWRGGPWQDWIRERYQPLAERLEVRERRPAQLRTTLIALLIQEGITFEELSAQVGGELKGLKLAYGWQIRAAAKVGHVPAVAAVERARRQAQQFDQEGLASSENELDGMTRR